MNLYTKNITRISLCLYAATSFAQTRVLGPYITAMDRDAPLVVLHTEAETEVSATLQGGPDGPVLQQVSNGRHHNFTLPVGPGITSATYTLQIGDEVIQHQLTYPDPAAETYSFVVLGDAQNPDSSRRRTAVMAALAAHDPVFILQTGDLNVGISPKLGDAADVFGGDWRLNFFEPMPELQARVPKYTVFGNHDDELEGQRAAFQTVFPGLPDNGCYHFQHGPAAFFFLDIQNQIEEFFRKGQDAWLRDAVSEYPDATWRIAVFHVSPWSGGHRGERPWTVGGRERMLEVLQELGIDLVFCGHDHNYQRIKPVTMAGSDKPPVQIVITGVAGSSFYNAEEKAYTERVINRKDHFCRVDVSLEKLAIQALTPEGEVLDSFEILRNPPRDFAVWLRERGGAADPETAFGALSENGVPLGIEFALAENLLPDEPLLLIRLLGDKVIVDLPAQTPETGAHVRLTVKTIEDLTRPLSEWTPVTRPADDQDGKPPHRRWLQMDSPEHRAFFFLEGLLLGGELPYIVQPE